MLLNTPWEKELMSLKETKLEYIKKTDEIREQMIGMIIEYLKEKIGGSRRGTIDKWTIYYPGESGLSIKEVNKLLTDRFPEYYWYFSIYKD